MGYSEPAPRLQAPKRERTISWVLLLLFVPLYGISILLTGSAMSNALIGHGGVAANAAHREMIFAKCFAMLPLAILLASVIVGSRSRHDSWKDIWWVPLGGIVLALAFCGEVAFIFDWFG